MSSERTEDPTPKRIQEAREEGRIARSIDLNAAAALLISVLLFQFTGQRMVWDTQSLITDALTAIPNAAGLPDANDLPAWLGNFASMSVLKIAPGFGIIILGLLVAGVVISFAQTGFLFTTKKLGFDFGRVNPMQGLKRVFSLHGLAELIKGFLKLGIVGWATYSFLNSRMNELLGLSQNDFRFAVSYWTDLALSLAMRVASVYLVLALVDYGFQRWQYTRSLRMTKQEIKEEIKQQEGDPITRGRIRGQQRRMARQRMMAKVPQASVVIVNPTHLAVAIQYDAEAMKAPKVLAKGAHLTAERIVSIARQRGIPVIQDIPVARAIYRYVDLDEEIPPTLYAAVAQILAYVFRLRGRALQGRSIQGGVLDRNRNHPTTTTLPSTS